MGSEEVDRSIISMGKLVEILMPSMSIILEAMNSSNVEVLDDLEDIGISDKPSGVIVLFVAGFVSGMADAYTSECKVSEASFNSIRETGRIIGEDYYNFVRSIEDGKETS